MAKTFGSYISLLVLILEGGKICVSIAMIVYSMTVDGVLGARAICVSLFCGKYVSTQNRLEKAKRRRLRNAQSMDQDVEMKNLRSNDESMDVD